MTLSELRWAEGASLRDHWPIRLGDGQQRTAGIDDLTRRRVALLYDRGPATILAGIGVAALSAIFLWDVARQPWLAIWLGCYLACSGARLWQAGRFRADFNGTADPRLWERRYVLWTFATGAMWGAFVWFLDPAWPSVYETFVACVAAGITAGSIPANSASRQSLVGFILLVILPLAAWFVATGQTGYIALGLMVTIYAIVMIGFGWRYNQILLNSVALADANVTLADQLRQRNRDLVTELESRGRILDQLQESERFSRSTFEQAGVAMVIVDRSGDVLKVNRAAADLLGYRREDMLGKPILELTHSDDRQEHRAQFSKLVAGELDRYVLNQRYLHKDGALVWTLLTVAAVRDEQGRFLYAVGQAQDVSEQQALNERLRHQANHDPLTGLVNRSGFERALDDLIRQPGAERGHVLCYLDLDQFKVVNDTCGHVAGDELLRQLTTLLSRRVRRGDLLARLGGDEFALILRDCSAENAVRVVEGILKAVREFRFLWDEKLFGIGISIGVVAFRPGEHTREELLSYADSACYAAKEAGRDRYHLYQEADEKLAQRAMEMQWVPRLNEALAEGHFSLFRQVIRPVGGTQAGVPDHFEALLRLSDADGAVHPPGRFMPAAERYNLAGAIDCWVVGRVIDWLTGPGRAQPVQCCSVNLSGVTLGDGERLREVAAMVEAAGEAARQLCFEITETAAIANLAHTRAFMERLRGSGCRFALDDFGSGLSSFAYLKQLPVDYLKIDGVFVRDIAHDDLDRALVASINEIGHVMGMKTVAEFVENEAILACLQDIGVDYVQGYGIGRPEPWL